MPQSKAWRARQARAAGAVLAFLLCVLCLALPANAAGAPRLLEIKSGIHSWGEDTCTNIFSSARLANQPVLEPGSQGTYPFTVTGTTTASTTYTLTLQEDNPLGVPVEFRLEGESGFLAGSEETWLPATEISALTSQVMGGATQSYTLHWRWLYSTGEEGDSYDTTLGGSADATEDDSYTLTLHVYAEQAEEPPPASSGGAGGQTASGTSSQQDPGDGNPNTTGTASTNTNATAGTAAGARRRGAQNGRVAQTGNTPNLVLAALAFGAFTAAITLFALRAAKRKKP